MPKYLRFFLLVTLLVLAAIELAFVKTEFLTFSDSWFLLLLVLLGALSLFGVKEGQAVPVLCLLLASLSVLFSFVDPDELLLFGDRIGWLLGLFWQALLGLFPFVFIHFALIFPVTSSWLGRSHKRILALYSPYAVLLGLARFDPTASLAGLFLVLTIPIGLLVGVTIFVRQYRSELSLTEKLRLRLILFGCLGGLLPRVLAAVGEAVLPFFLQQLAHFLLPLFPLCLVLAVVWENLSEAGPVLQQLLFYLLVSATMLSIFFVVFLVASIRPMEGESWLWLPLVLSVGVSLLLLSPVAGWMASSLSQDPFRPSADSGRPGGEDGAGFQPIDPNPYIAGNPIHSPRMFFGREEEFHLIQSRLRPGKQGGVILLSGERRVGKTSILYQILNGRLGASFIPVFFDLQALIVESDFDFLEELARSIARAFSAAHPGAPALAVPPIAAYSDFSGLLRTVFEEGGDRHLVLLIDEYELIDYKVGQGTLSREIYSYLNSLLEPYPRLSMVLAGSKDLRMSPEWSHILGKATRLRLSFLSKKDTWRLITEPVANGVRLRSDAVNRLWRLGNGHPFLTQALCQLMVDVLNESEKNVVDQRLVKAVIARFLDNPPPQLFYEWAGLSLLDKLILSALATLLPRAESFIAADRVDRLVLSLPNRFHQDLDRATIRMQLEGLRQRSFLDRDQLRYRFSMDLYRLWIQSEHNIWNVLNEFSDSGGTPSAFTSWE